MIWLLVALSLFRPTIEFGQVLNDKGDGVVLDYATCEPVDPYYNYVHYDGFQKGDYVYTLYIYNPEYAYLGTENDDIIFRYDMKGD